METNNPTEESQSKFDFSSLLARVPKDRNGRSNPLAATRSQSMADFADRTAEIQKAHPDVDFKSGVIELTVNYMFDLKEKLDTATYESHQRFMADMIKYLSPPSPPGEQQSDHSPNAEKAEEAFWGARKCLEGHDDVLRLFDSVYLREDRPLEVTFGQLREAFALKAKMMEALAQGDMTKGEEVVNDGSD